MRMYEIIEKKRDGGKLTHEELNFFISGMLSGSIPDYQTSALLMAIYLKGMDGEETADLTNIMANSGDLIDLSSIKGIKVDKHSTGGVGDKTTLIIAPVVAACGIPVAKMSGRGLGHTGGTIDKLESIPGFRTEMSVDEFISNVKKIGVAIAGQSKNIAPADKALYAMRDVTATVSSIPLIASSIMSKKIAAGADAVVLDVTTGSGAFMKDIEHSLELARKMIEIGEKTGIKTVAYMTDMDSPVGFAIGNSLEVIEAIDTLKGRGPKDLQEISLELAAKMIELATDMPTEDARERAKDAILSGRALDKFKEMVLRQGGDPNIVDDYSLFETAKIKYDLISENEGYIRSMNATAVGTASMMLGAGRESKEDIIDHAAGIVLHKKTRMHVDVGDVIATLYTNDENKLNQAVPVLKEAITFSAFAPPAKPLILAYADSKSVLRYID